MRPVLVALSRASSDSAFVSLSPGVISALALDVGAAVVLRVQPVSAGSGAISAPALVWNGHVAAAAGFTVEVPACVWAPLPGHALARVVPNVPRAARVRAVAVGSASWAVAVTCAREVEGALLSQVALVEAGRTLRVALPGGAGVVLRVVAVDVSGGDAALFAAASCALLVDGTSLEVEPEAAPGAVVGADVRAVSAPRVGASMRCRVLQLAERASGDDDARVAAVNSDTARHLLSTSEGSDGSGTVHLSLDGCRATRHSPGRRSSVPPPAVTAALLIDDGMPRGHVALTTGAAGALAAAMALHHATEFAADAAPCPCGVMLRPHGAVHISIAPPAATAATPLCVRLRPFKPLLDTTRNALAAAVAAALELRGSGDPAAAHSRASVCVGALVDTRGDQRKEAPRAGEPSIPTIPRAAQLLVVVAVELEEATLPGGGTTSITRARERGGAAQPTVPQSRVLVGEPLPAACGREFDTWRRAWDSAPGERRAAADFRVTRADAADAAPPAPDDPSIVVAAAVLRRLLDDASSAPPPLRALVVGSPASGRSAYLGRLAQACGCGTSAGAAAAPPTASHATPTAPFHAERVACRDLVGKPFRDVSFTVLRAWARCAAFAPALLLLDDVDRLVPREAGAAPPTPGGSAGATDGARGDDSAADAVATLLATLVRDGIGPPGAAHVTALVAGADADSDGDDGDDADRRRRASARQTLVDGAWRALMMRDAAAASFPAVAAAAPLLCVVATAEDAHAVHPTLRGVGALDRVLCTLRPSPPEACAEALVAATAAAAAAAAISVDAALTPHALLRLCRRLPARAAEQRTIASAAVRRAVDGADRRPRTGATPDHRSALFAAPGHVVVAVRHVAAALDDAAAVGGSAADGAAGASTAAADADDGAWDAGVGGLAEVKRALLSAIALSRRYAAAAARAPAGAGPPPPPPVRLPRAALLYGPPGCGKTLLGAAAAAGAGVRLLTVRGPELLSKYVGESEAGVRRVFAAAAAAAPCILFFDEFDALAPRRGGGASGVSDRVVNTLLVELDGVRGAPGGGGGVFVLAATSRPLAVDPALLRPGRIELALHCAPPGAVDRAAVLGALARRLVLAPDARSALPLVAAADEADGFTGADLRGVLVAAQLAAVRERVDGGGGGGGGGAAVIQLRHLEAALAGARPSLTRAQRAHYAAVAAAMGDGGGTAAAASASAAAMDNVELDGEAPLEVISIDTAIRADAGTAALRAAEDLEGSRGGEHVGLM